MRQGVWGIGQFLLVLLFLAVPAQAQNTGGVFGPVVNEGARTLQYRAAVNPDPNNSLDFGFAHRLHYQQAINDDFMWRVLGQTVRTEDSDFDFDFIGAELFWEFSENEDDYKHGVRFDARYRDDDRSEQLGFNWTHQWNFAEGWSAQAILLTLREFGQNRNDGINIQTRTRVTKKLGNGFTLGVENYSNYGNTGNFGGFDEQSHTIGPIFSIPVANKISIFGGPLFGLTDGSADVEGRLWVTQNF